MYIHANGINANGINVFVFSCLSCSPQPSFRFVATEFSECSKVCGCGRQYRTIQCFDFLGEEQLEEVDIRTCSLYADNQTLPSPLSQSCNNFTCPEWRVGNFSEVNW